MGRSKKGNSSRKDGEAFRIVQRSYEDKDYEIAPKSLLVPVSKTTGKINRVKKPTIIFGEDMPEDYSEKRNMLMVDNTVEDAIFEDEVEEEFDQDFIRQIMTGDGVEGFDEEIPQLEDDEYPRHDKSENRVIERQFDKMMAAFDMDEDIEQEDPRTHGALPAEQYAAAMEADMRDHAMEMMSMTSDVPLKHRNLLKSLRRLADEHRVFNRGPDGGEYRVVPDKDTRTMEEFLAFREGLKKITLELVQHGLVDEEGTVDEARLRQQILSAYTQGRSDEEDHCEIDTGTTIAGTGGEAKRRVVINLKSREDCETILTTYSNLYNHPNVITSKARQEKANLKKNLERSATCQVDAGRKSQVLTAEALKELGGKEDDDDHEEFEEEEEEVVVLQPSDLSHRPKDEDREEKKLRRQLVKQHQRERRADKKLVRKAYQEADTLRKTNAGLHQQNKATQSLSVVRGGIITSTK